MILIKEGTIQEAMALEQELPDFTKTYSEEKYISKLNNAYSLILIAYENEKPIGFKVGYAINENTFYSWVGGVLPKHRRKHVGQLLLEKQEHLVKEKGYSNIQVKSKNIFPNMLRFLIANNYFIIDYIDDKNILENKIVFEKTLN